MTTLPALASLSGQLRTRLRLRTTVGDLQELLGGTLLVLNIRVGGAILAYLSAVLLARWLGAFEFGIYTYVWAWANLLAIALPLGMNTAILRLVPEYHARGFGARLLGTVARARLLTGLASTAFLILAILLFLLLHERLPAHYRVPVALALACVPLIAFMDLYEAIGRAMGWLGLAYAPPYILQPLLVLLGVGGLVMIGGRADAAAALAVLLVASCVCLAAQALPAARRLRRRFAGKAPRHHTRYWMAIALPLLMTEGFRALIEHTDILVLGALAGPQDVASYFAALRTAGLLGFLHFAVAAMAVPKIAAIHASESRQALQDFVATVVALSFWPSLLAAAGLLLIGPFVLTMFGPDFARAYPALAVLACAFLFRASMGPVEYILNVTGHQALCARIFGFVAVYNLLANVVLISLLGMLGAAIATGSAIVLASGWLFVEVMRRLGIVSCVAPKLIPARLQSALGAGHRHLGGASQC